MVHTRAGTVEVKGTVFALEVSNQAVTLWVLRGRVQVREKNAAPRSVRRGQYTVMGPGGTHPVRETDRNQEAVLLARVRTLEMVSGISTHTIGWFSSKGQR